MCHDGCALVAWCSRRTRLFEQRRCSGIVPRAVVLVGGDEEAPARVALARWRRKSKRLLGKIGGRSRRPAGLRRSSCLLHDRCDASIRLRRGEREVPRSLLARRDDVGEPSMQGSAPPGCLARDDCRAEQRMSESDVLAVELENPRVERLGEPGSQRAPIADSKSVTVGSASAGHSVNDVERLRAEAVDARVQQLVQARRDRRASSPGASVPPRRWSAAASSSAKSGLPREVSQSLINTGRANVASRRSWSSSWVAPRLRPVTGTVRSWLSGTARRSQSGTSPRTATSAATG